MEENTNWSLNVGGVCIKDGKVLLARHTYGSGNGKLIIPGGYLQNSESPEMALKREFMEEVAINVEPQELIGIRFNSQCWYAVFFAEYVSGIASSDNDENSEVVWMDINEALKRDDVPDLTKQMIACAINRKYALTQLPYNGKNPPNSLYGTKKED